MISHNQCVYLPKSLCMIGISVDVLCVNLELKSNLTDKQNLYMQSTLYVEVGLSIHVIGRLSQCLSCCLATISEDLICLS